MQLHFARWVTKIESASEGINKPDLCIVKLQNGALARAYVKAIPARRMTVEILCAALADALGLPTAAPMIVRMPDPAEPIRYGAGMISAPNFRHWLSAQAPEAMRRIQAWAGLVPAACFDEWIANADRNAGNFLHDGRNGFWLIDHEAALPENCGDAPFGDNTLMAIAAAGYRQDELGTKLAMKVQRTLQDFTQQTTDGLNVFTTVPALDAVQSVIDAIRLRQPCLPKLGASRVPPQQGDLLDGAQG